jgi:TRAP-type C4-dicarboxylate transport system permease small subunit
MTREELLVKVFITGVLLGAAIREYRRGHIAISAVMTAMPASVWLVEAIAWWKYR